MKTYDRDLPEKKQKSKQPAQSVLQGRESASLQREASAHPLLKMQRAYGNRHVMRHVAVQAKNPINNIQRVPFTKLEYSTFYFIAADENADAYSFLEMDDAVIAREVERAAVEYVFVRNISDPVVPSHALN